MSRLVHTKILQVNKVIDLTLVLAGVDEGLAALVLAEGKTSVCRIHPFAEDLANDKLDGGGWGVELVSYLVVEVRCFEGYVGSVRGWYESHQRRVASR